VINLKNVPIKQKLTTAIMLTSAVVLFLTVAVFTIHGIFSFRQRTEDFSYTLARITAAQGAAAVDYDNVADCRKILSKFNTEKLILEAALYGKNGKILASYPENKPSTSFPPVPRARGYRIQHSSVLIFVPVQQDNRPVGWLYLKWDLSPEYRRIRWAAGVLALLLVGSMGVALIISNILQRGISQPILQLAALSKAVSANHDYSVRAVKAGDDELGALTDAFNQMLTRIGEQGLALRKNEEKLRKALDAARTSATQIRVLNAELENRVKVRTAELAAANHELEAFTYTVSHDLRAPIRHIDGFAQLLELEVARNPDGARQLVARIRHSAQNMSRMTDGLLALSRIGHVTVKFQPVRLGAVVNEVLAELRSELRGRTIEWRIAELPEVWTDPGLIKQVFANLISNAVKYTRLRPQAVIEIGSEPTDTAACIFIRDNGAGFDMNHAGKLFGVFQRLHSSEEFEGNGIGLATVQRIIQLHGGRIWFEAEVDRGATFHFTLPNGPPPDSPPAANEEAAPQA
jgi:signal transduction histidine kinase